MNVSYSYIFFILITGFHRLSIDLAQSQAAPLYEYFVFSIAVTVLLTLAERIFERGLFLEVRPLDHCRILDAPVRGHRLPRPYRTGFGGGVVADGKREIHLRGIRGGELALGFGAEASNRNVGLLERLQRQRAHFAPESKTGRETKGARLTDMVDQGLL